MKVIVKRMASCPPYSDEFMEALHQLTRERGGGYIPKHDVEARAATLRVIPKPLPLPPIKPLPLPVIR